MYLVTALVIVALVATVAVLFIGIGSMARGGEYDEAHSVQLMSARVWFQAIAVFLIIAAAMYVSRLA